MTAGTVLRPPAPDLRSLIGELERTGRLRRISKSVDPAWEPGSLVKWMFQGLPDARRFAMLFENVRGSAMPLLVGALGASTANVASALGVGPAEINATLMAAMRNPIAPRTVDSGICQQVVKTATASLRELPIPTWTPEKDAAPYITAMVVTKNESTGVHNTGVYRTQVVDERHVLVNLSPNRQGTRNVQTFLDAGKKAPIAWVIGAVPALYVGAVANLPYGQDEMHLAGALLGKPVELVRARTQDLFVPAEAELIIEGEVTAGNDAVEGPFGEFAGFMSHPGKRPLVTITAITHRENPIYLGLSSQMPPSESTILQSLTNSAVLLKTLRDDLGDTNVLDVYIDPTFGGVLAHGIVAIKTHYPGHGRRIGRLVADLSGLKRVTVVDEDIDIRDPDHVDWALNARYNPAGDTEIIDNVFYFMDPALPRAESRTRAMGSKLVIDATQKYDPGTFSLPPRATMMRALEVWKEIGLPEFEAPRRALSRIERA